MRIKNRKRTYRIVIVSVLACLVIAEITLRYVFGLCDAVLYRSDPNFEYIYQPNQSRFRFRKHIRTNEFSMRGEPLKKKSVKILGMGDSVLEGGVLTDQDSLATTRLTKSFSALYDTAVQVLNVAAGSWGPDNSAAYVKKYGDFGSKVYLMVVSSHDAYDIMNFEPCVGLDPHYPNKQYSFALYEAFDRYFLKLFKHDRDDSGIRKDGKVFDPGFYQILDLARQHQVPLLIYLHPEISERKKGMYNMQGQKIIRFAQTNNIPLIKELDYTFTEKDYRDYIHLSEQGQKHMYDVIYPVLKHELDKIITR